MLIPEEGTTSSALDCVFFRAVCLAALLEAFEALPEEFEERVERVVGIPENEDASQKEKAARTIYMWKDATLHLAQLARV